MSRLREARIHRKETREFWREYIGQMRALPTRDRIRIAWKILFGFPEEKRRYPKPKRRH